MPNHQIILHVPSELGYEKIAMASVATVAKRMGFSTDRIEDIKTAVAEACINAIEHGNELNVDIPVIIELNERNRTLEIKVSDVGRNLIPCPLPQAGDSPRHRGWGMFLIQSLVDEFDFGLTPQGGNYIRMCLRLAPSQARA